MDHERRLFHVPITMAKSRLQIFWGNFALVERDGRKLLQTSRIFGFVKELSTNSKKEMQPE